MTGSRPSSYGLVMGPAGIGTQSKVGGVYTITSPEKAIPIEQYYGCGASTGCRRRRPSLLIGVLGPISLPAGSLVPRRMIVLKYRATRGRAKDSVVTSVRKSRFMHRTVDACKMRVYAVHIICAKWGAI